ncbi:hypothetical protein P7D22_16195 [Lichenihabitans sp. Uapishka_5]|uniref:hypothetical protein n=1 Tax=Lichenihabitans sp. Uapishka_5 TaxID=3037302 RepID=UPI0029E7D371|nr:hypothetical protein [Lichenihabitans sp. Uapishka_5]MDX7952709.1 hypothetical protein [Lichenihabitans sp. Uapishka_5]
MRLPLILTAGAAFLACTGLASAESQRERQERACQADAMKFCKDFVPNEEKIAACMGQHRPELSTNCGIIYDAGMRKK